MRPGPRSFLLVLALCGTGAAAEPAVVADILPVASLVAQVMDGVGTPRLALPTSASPHGHALRPSDAAALQAADLLVWTGPALTPWLAEARETLAPDAASLVLLDVPGTRLLEFGAEHHHGHGGSASEAAHVHAANQGSGRPDPHAWLDPDNAKLWLGAIAETLSGADPTNAALFRENAAEGRARIDAATAYVEATLARVRGEPFAVYHDAYRYFETRFGLSGGIPFASSEASTPGPRTLAAMREALAASGARCLFAEPQFDASRAAPLTDGLEIEVAILDPLGSGLAPGPDLYPALLSALAENLAACLG